MWHETRQEMVQLLKSVFRMDADQMARWLAMMVYHYDDPDYYDFEGLYDSVLLNILSYLTIVELADVCMDMRMYICMCIIMYICTYECIQNCLYIHMHTSLTMLSSCITANIFDSLVFVYHCPHVLQRCLRVSQPTSLTMLSSCITTHHI